ncbi:MAG: hypothetical protein Q4C71_02795 [Microbacteriaceae bacterium]|nr:hypothetical protein [Microbacteriaceae bacterium]
MVAALKRWSNALRSSFVRFCANSAGGSVLVSVCLFREFFVGREADSLWSLGAFHGKLEWCLGI